MANAAVDMADFFSKLAPMFFGSGKSTSSTSGNPAGITNAQDLLALIMPQITGTKDTDAVVSNIMTRAAQAFAPVLGSQNQAGLYNSTVKQQLLSEAMARATGESASAVLQHQTAAGQTAASINGNLIRSSQTQSTKTAPTVDPRISSALAIAMMGKSIFNEFKSTAKKAPVSVGKALSPLPPGGETAASAQDALTQSGDSLATDTGDFTAASDTSAGASFADTASAGGLNATSIGSSSVDAGSVLSASDLSAGAASSNLSGVSVASSGLLLDTPELIAQDAIGATGTGALTGDAAGVLATGSEAVVGADTAATIASDAIGAGGFEEAIGGASFFEDVAPIAEAAASAVICTELMEQGLLDKELWKSGAWHYQGLNPYVLIGYHSWGRPYVRLMKRSKLATAFIRPWAVGRYEYIAGKKNFRGWLTCAIGEKVCKLLGHILCPLFLDYPINKVI